MYIISQEGKEVRGRGAIKWNKYRGRCFFSFALQVAKLCTGEPIFSSCSVATVEVVDVSGGKSVTSQTEAAGLVVSVSERKEKEAVGEGGGEESEEDVEEMDVLKEKRAEVEGEEGGSEVRLFCGSHDSCVYCWSGRNRRLLWKTALDSEIYSTPVACSLHSSQTAPPDHLTDPHPPLLNLVCVCSSRGVLYLLDVETGRVWASLRLPYDVFSSPVIVDNHMIIVGCRDDCVYGIECSIHC